MGERLVSGGLVRRQEREALSKSAIDRALTEPVYPTELTRNHFMGQRQLLPFSWAD
jgi:hypothetical protein